jgi:hypothetical protein
MGPAAEGHPVGFSGHRVRKCDLVHEAERFAVTAIETIRATNLRPGWETTDGGELV